jgi:diguanylate cyclase (GGDEF)-like protein/PAS domain S-box-containing protein
VADLTTQLSTGVPPELVGPRALSTPSAVASTLRLERHDLDDLLKGLADGIILLSLDGQIIYASPPIRTTLGYDPSLLVGRPIRVFLHPDDEEDASRLLLVGPVERGEADPEPMPLSLRHADGGWREVEMTPAVSPRLAGHGLVGMIVRDRKDRRNTLDALRHRMAFEDLLTKVASSFILRTPDEIDDGIHDALADVGRFVDVDRAYVYVVDEDHAVVENTHAWSAATLPPELERPRVVPFAEAPRWMEELRALEPIYIPRVADLADDWSKEQAFLQAQGTQSVLAAPLVDRGRLAGFIGFDSITSERLWSDDHLSLLMSTAGVVSQALARRDAEQRFALGFEAAPLGMALIGPDGQHVQVNRAYCELVGRDEDQLIGRPVLEFIHPADRLAVIDEYAALASGDTDHATLELRSGPHLVPTRWFRGHMAAVRTSSGAIRYLVSHLEDITERHQHEAELRMSEERYRTLVENSPAVVTRFDRNRRMVYMSPSFEELGPWRIGDVLGETSHGVADGDEFQRWESALQRVFDSGQRHDTEWEIAIGDGETMWFQSRAVPEFDENGEVEFVLVMNTDITALKRSEAELAHQAMHDPLTGLANRALFLDHLRSELARGERRSEALAVLFLDLDRFKVVNDSLGHSAGDELLGEVCRRLQSLLRGGDIVARLGGDEFVMLLPDVNGPEETVAIAQRVLAAIRRPIRVDGDEVFSTASMGIALWHATGQGDGTATAEALVRDADTAMYRAKARGRDRYEIFDEDLRTQATAKFHLENFLRKAVELGELEVHYQPEIDLETGALAGAEALVRWRHPVEGLLEAKTFIDLAEESGLILDVGSWVLKEACRQVGVWKREESRELGTLRVNLSPRQIAHPDLLDTVVQALEIGGLEPSSLCLEITETALMSDAAASLSVLSALRSLGVELAIDDFGTGYSSLSYLKRFPVTVLKIDRSFVDGLGHDPDDTAIAGAIVSLGRSLGLSLVAEGVETPRHLHELRRLGCDRAQGFLFSAALPPDQFWSLDPSTSSRIGC